MGKLVSTVLKHAPKKATTQALYTYALARSLTFLSQSLSLPVFEFLVTGKTKKAPAESFGHLKAIYQEVMKLLKADAENIAQGLYPLEVLAPEPVKAFVGRYPKIVLDGVSLVRRRLGKKSQDFNHEAAQYFRDVPDYFQRNFHFQTDGYLTDKSAELYEHQVEILFAGAADAMRRLLLPQLKQHFPYSEGEGLHFLEVAAGTGRLSKFVKLTFPKAKITVMDVSPPYLKKAQSNLQDFKRIDFVQGDAAYLPFKDQQFDAVYSCFLFHELPHEERKKVVAEGFRVLKSQGFYGLVDSVQNEDKKEFNWALEQFPVDFHEPFFKNYLHNPMEGLLKNQGFSSLDAKMGFLAKALKAVKP